MSKAEKMEKRLKPWLNALHYGKDQEMMHSCTGWFLGRNILQIERDEIAGALARNECAQRHTLPSTRNS